MSEWYYAVDGKQNGPIPSVELKRLAAAGEIRADDLVWREGLTEWTQARNVQGLFEAAPKFAVVADLQSKPDEAPAEPPRTLAPVDAAARPTIAKPARHPVEFFLDALRASFDDKFIVGATGVFRACGRYGLLVAIVLVLAFTVGAAMQANALDNVLSGTLLILLLAVLQYASVRILDSSDRLNDATSGRLASIAIPSLLALLSLVAAVAALFVSAPAAVFSSMYPLVILGIGWFVALSFLAVVFLNPSSLNFTISADRMNPAEEAIDVLMFLGKSVLRAAPVFFGVGTIVGTCVMTWACCELFFVGAPPRIEAIAHLARGTLIVSAALPPVVYASFLLWCLLLGVVRAMLRLPGNAAEPPASPETQAEGRSD